MLSPTVERMVIDTLKQLKQAKYRQGFNDSVASVVTETLYDAKYDDAARAFWIDFCNVMDYKIPMLTEKYGEEIVKQFKIAYEESQKEGKFEIPSYYGGNFTRGT